MNNEKPKLLDRLISLVKTNPFESALIISPLFFLYLLPKLSDSIVSEVFVYIIVALLAIGTIAYIVLTWKSEEKSLIKKINNSLIFGTIFLTFGAGKGLGLLTSLEQFSNIIMLLYVFMVIIVLINLLYNVYYLKAVFNKETATFENKGVYIFGISLFYLIFMVAEPLNQAVQGTIAIPTGMNSVPMDSYVDKIFFALITIVIIYIVTTFTAFLKKEKFIPEESKNLVDVSGSVIAIIIGLLFGLVLMLIFNPSEAFKGFSVILSGGFNDGYVSMGNMIYYSVPIILTGLSVAFAFKTGLFNIGATGQLTMGAFVAVYIGIEGGALGEISPLLHWGTAIVGAMIMGGIWGSIPGFLKAYRNVNEVVSSIMLNYVAMYMNVLLIKKHIFNQAYSRTFDIKLTAATPKWNLDFLFPGSSISGTIVVAVITVVILHIILNKTTFGYELKSVGFNRSASKYAGMNEKRNIVLSMAISGAVAGLAGAMIYLSPGKFLKPENILLAEGFLGIAIALLGLSSPFGVLIAGLFYGSLQQGGYYLQLLNFKPEIIDIIIAVIIYMSALGLFLQKFIKAVLKKRPGYKEEGSDK